MRKSFFFVCVLVDDPMENAEHHQNWMGLVGSTMQRKGWLCTSPIYMGDKLNINLTRLHFKIILAMSRLLTKLIYYISKTYPLLFPIRDTHILARSTNNDLSRSNFFPNKLKWKVEISHTCMVWFASVAQH